MSSEISDFETALAEFQYDEAAGIAAASASRQELEDRLAAHRKDTMEAAYQLASRISALARQHDHLALLDVDEAEMTASLLALLPDSTQERAQIHLRGARHWGRRQVESNRRRLEEARGALDGLDIVLARSIVRRVEERFLTELEIAERDQLLLDISARSIEAEELAESADQIVAEEKQAQRRWWQRKGDR